MDERCRTFTFHPPVRFATHGPQGTLRLGALDPTGRPTGPGHSHVCRVGSGLPPVARADSGSPKRYLHARPESGEHVARIVDVQSREVVAQTCAAAPIFVDDQTHILLARSAEFRARLGRVSGALDRATLSLPVADGDIVRRSTGTMRLRIRA